MSVDFGQLIGAKSYEQLCQEVFADLAAAPGFPVTNLNVGAAFRTGTEAVLRALADLYQLLVDVAPQGFPTLSSGKWLVLHAAGVSMQQQELGKAQGDIKFGRNVTGEAVIIPAGTIVKTKTSDAGVEYRYRTLVEAVIPASQEWILALAEAEQAGTAYNVGAATITQLVTHVPGVDYITNDPDWLTTAGLDIESDDHLKDRYVLRWNELGAGNEDAYISWAKDHPEIRDVYLIKRARGADTVDLVGWGIAGNPTDQVIAEVQAHIDGKRPLTDDVLIRRPVLVDHAVEMLLIFSPKATDAEIEAGEAEAIRRLNAFYGPTVDKAIPRLAISQDVDRALLGALVRTVPRVVNATVIAPAEDILVAEGFRANLTSLTVTAVRGDRE